MSSFLDTDAFNTSKNISDVGDCRVVYTFYAKQLLFFA